MLLKGILNMQPYVLHCNRNYSLTEQPLRWQIVSRFGPQGMWGHCHTRTEFIVIYDLPPMFRHVPDHVRTWRVMFSMFSMFRACLEELNMLWTWHSKFHVQIVFRSRHLCSNHVWSCSACSEPVQIILNMKILNMIFMFQNMFFMFLNMTEHAETWLSCSEHEYHVQNMTVVF